MEIIQLIESDCEYFNQICLWYYQWLGKKNGESLEEVIYTMKHSINRDKLPQTFLAIENGTAIGMYQLAVFDDLYWRPDLYPWLINVYVDEKHRRNGVFRNLMNSLKENAKKANIKELYLYTSHTDLYEKFGWILIDSIPSFKDSSLIDYLYRLPIEE